VPCQHRGRRLRGEVNQALRQVLGVNQRCLQHIRDRRNGYRVDKRLFHVRERRVVFEFRDDRTHPVPDEFRETADRHILRGDILAGRSVFETPRSANQKLHVTALDQVFQADCRGIVMAAGGFIAVGGCPRADERQDLLLLIGAETRPLQCLRGGTAAGGIFCTVGGRILRLLVGNAPYLLPDLALAAGSALQPPAHRVPIPLGLLAGLQIPETCRTARRVHKGLRGHA